jgi:hypothetical protein
MAAGSKNPIIYDGTLLFLSNVLIIMSVFCTGFIPSVLKSIDDMNRYDKSSLPVFFIFFFIALLVLIFWTLFSFYSLFSKKKSRFKRWLILTYFAFLNFGVAIAASAFVISTVSESKFLILIPQINLISAVIGFSMLSRYMGTDFNIVSEEPDNFLVVVTALLITVALFLTCYKALQLNGILALSISLSWLSFLYGKVKSLLVR